LNGMNRSIYRLLVLAVLTGNNSCKKPEEGFLSDNIFYRANPFVAEQGIVAYSAALQTDGSTKPLQVKLLDIRNKSTGQSVLDDMTQEREVATFGAQILYTDTTLAQLKGKAATSMKRPLYVNPIGGRIELTTASRFIAAGNYVIDLEVENVKAKRIITNACDIQLKPAANPYTITYRRIQTSPPGNDANQTFITDNESGYPITVTYTSGTAANRVIFKWVDKNNKPFNPKTQMTRMWPNYPVFKDWSPYYPEVLTDSTMEYQFPQTGLSYPLYTQLPVVGSVGGDWQNGVSYYRVLASANDLNLTLRLTQSMQFHADGIYEVTYHLNLVNKL
jgi:hypothetical protein